MVNDLRSFDKRIKGRARAIPRNTDTLMRKVILAVDQALVLATPVDTGRARANWQPTIGSAAVGTLPEPSSPDGGLQIALTAGQEVAAAYRGGPNSPTVHITNNLPYIDRLNKGWSKQAPANYVHQAILVVQSVFGKHRITVR